MDLNAIFDMLSGEYGVIAILLFALLAILNGKVVPKIYYDQEHEKMRELMKAIEAQTVALDNLSKTTEKSLETSKTTLKFVQDLRETFTITYSPPRDLRDDTRPYSPPRQDGDSDV